MRKIMRAHNRIIQRSLPCTLHCTPACLTAVRTDDSGIPDDDADAWLAEPRLTESTCRVDRCSDGGKFSAARECRVRASPQRRTDQRRPIHRRQTAVTRTIVEGALGPWS